MLKVLMVRADVTCWPGWLHPPFSALEPVSGKERRICLERDGYVVAIYPEGLVIKLVCPATLKNQQTVWFLVGASAYHSGTLASLGNRGSKCW